MTLFSEETNGGKSKTPLIDKYKIPLTHFEYSYIETCSDGKELERIVSILRSGEEGYFPDLLKFAENRLVLIKPKSKLLQIATPVLNKEHLPQEEQRQLKNHLTQWLDNVTQNDNELASYKNRKCGLNNLPHVRASKVTEYSNSNEVISKRTSATDYCAWDKYDPDTEILKMELEEEQRKKDAKEKHKKQVKKSVQFQEFRTDVEASREADYEKNKGNEFYRTGDYAEALTHYTNSITYKPTVAGFTNRALVNIKLKRYKNTVDDCHSALSIEPDNIKALLRKTQAFDALGMYTEALEAVERVIELEPNNISAQALAQKVRSKSGLVLRNTRLKIHDCEEKNESNDKEIIIPIPGTSRMAPPYYVKCPRGKLDKVKEEIVKAAPYQILHMVSIDSSDDDDDEDDGVKIEEITEDGILKKNFEEVESCSEENSGKVEVTTRMSLQGNMQEDKHAGGEPFAPTRPVGMPDDFHAPYSFLKAWNSANGDNTMEQHAAILRSLDMNRIVHVIGCKLDNAIFSQLVKCLSMHFVVPDEVSRLHEILQNLVKLPRFDIVTMLMSQEDRNCVNTLINFLKQHDISLSKETCNKLLN